VSLPIDLRTIVASSDLVIRLVTALCGVSVIIRTLELLSRPNLFDSSGSLSWQLIRELCPFGDARWFRALLAGRCFYVVLGARAVASCGLLLFAWPSLLLPSVLIVALSSLLISLRMPLGQDGSDQMNILILIPSSLALLCHHELAKTAVLLFIAGQVSLAYATSGVSKLISPLWRSGNAIPQILSTITYGNGVAFRVLTAHSALSRIASWSVILFEMFFWCGILAGPRASLVILAIGVLFHLSCALVMGLNCFFWSFIATYPAVLFSSAYLWHLLQLNR
jgi:hypothetical protein